MYKLTFIDERDQKQFRFIEAYSAKQAEVILKKREGWHIRLQDITVEQEIA